HGAGCGCKISPKVLSQILAKGNQKAQVHANLLVGNAERDDAAVFDLGDGSAVISTTDFFMPIVDDPFDFGRIAPVNAISDVYARGGTPLVAIAILGWPIDKLPAEVASQVMEGARAACRDANIPLGVGHSIDSPEPIFGLAVTGRVEVEKIKRNSRAQSGDILFLTKPLGVGILTTAQKKGILKPEHSLLARDSMIRLNVIGKELADLEDVHAMTDVTGFGLAGHLIEMCEGSNVHAQIELEKVPLIDAEAIDAYLKHDSIPGGTHRNFDSYGSKIQSLSARQKAIICDPQTSGGLLLAVAPSAVQDISGLLKAAGLHAEPVGKIIQATNLPELINIV
ncbi:MAG: selenide, water dikinase SelD, partial [Bacteroidetes bacterium]